MAGTKRRRSTHGDDAHSNDPSSTAALAATISRAPVTQRPQEPGSHADAYFASLYANEPDFEDLGRADSDFGKLLRSGKPDFNQPRAVMQLTKTLLKVDFGLNLELPDDKLCPPVLNRHNYILWIKSLMDSTSYDEADRKLTGLDIGTGASCIYPLLGCTQRKWSFLGTDIDPTSISYAEKNIRLNNLQSRIQLLKRDPRDSLIPLDEVSSGIDFVMTNPPFYESDDELIQSAQKKSRPPFSACTGAPHEMVTEGGEVAFVSRIIDESAVLRERVQWYTSMLGKQSSLEAIIGKIREKGIDNFAVTQFVQGKKTRRWAVGWSYQTMRPSASIARGMNPEKWKKILPINVDCPITSAPVDQGVSQIETQIRDSISSLELISWDWSQEKLRGVGRARENVWSRAWRRKKKALEMRGGEDTEMSASAGDSETCAIGFEVRIEVKATGVDVICTWREGHDSSIFESFCGFLKTRLKDIGVAK